MAHFTRKRAESCVKVDGGHFEHLILGVNLYKIMHIMIF